MLIATHQPLPDGCISDLGFDRWHAGELEEAEAEDLEMHLRGCTSCREREQQLSEQAQTFLAQFPKLELQGRTGTLVVPLKSRRWRALSLLGAGLAAAAGLALVLRQGPPAPTSFSDTGARSKGAARIGFHVKHGTRVFTGTEGQNLYPGDQVRFVVSTSKPQHLAILSRDGAGKVSEYYPGTGQSCAIPMGQNLALETSVELDSTLGTEELWGVFCDAPFSVEPLRSTLASRHALPTSLGCTVDRLHFIKQAAQ
jgi:hypothetical protein